MADLSSDDKLHRNSSGLGSYPEINVPVYAAVKGVSINAVNCASFVLMLT